MPEIPFIPWYVLVIIGGIGFICTGYALLTHYKKEVLTLPDTIEDIRKKSNPKMNRFAAERERKVAEKQTILDNQLKERTKAAIELDEIPKRMEEQNQATEIQHLVGINVLSRALEMNMDSMTYLEVAKKQHFDRLDLEKQWTEIEQKLKAGFLFAEKEHQYLSLHKEVIFGLFEEKRRLESGDELAKDDKLKFLNKWIEGEEQVFSERQKRLLQASTREDLRGSDEDSID